jgi:hypothetical protein
MSIGTTIVVITAFFEFENKKLILQMHYIRNNVSFIGLSCFERITSRKYHNLPVAYLHHFEFLILVPAMRLRLVVAHPNFNIQLKTYKLLLSLPVNCE